VELTFEYTVQRYHYSPR